VIVFGINPVLESLRAGRVSAIRVGLRADARLGEVIALARAGGVRVERVDPSALDRLARGGVHQGVVADVTVVDHALRDLVPADRSALIVVLDGIEDAQNVGAIARTVDAAGADGLVRQTRRAAPLDAAAAKASSGALAHVKVASVVNIARALEELKEAGVWTAGLAAGAPTRYDRIDLTVPMAIVVGSEGAGLRRLVRERCDFLVGIPMRGHVESLNVSVATAIVLFEAVRQRR
jgi:23S rRNA (guanosine2251-2'-O)-methyltransferase